MRTFKEFLEEVSVDKARREEAIKKAKEAAERFGGKISSKQLATLCGNSWFMEAILPYLTDEALAERAAYYVSNSRYPRDVPAWAPASCYDEALNHKIIPELVRRLLDKRDQQGNEG